MDEFSYLSVLLSIILGLAITQILKGFRGLLQSRARVRFYWPSITWAILLLVINVQTWWAMFGLRSHHDWTFAAFAVVLLQTILLYMMAGLVLPDFFGEGAVDLRANYYAHHGWFFGLAVLDGLVSIAKDHVVFIATAGVAALVRNEWYHKITVVIVTVLFTSYIAMLFVHLR
jgi:hypothetical protein